MKILNPFQRFFRGQNEKSAGDYNGGWVTIGEGADKVNESNLLAANKEWVFIAVDRVAQSVAGVRFKVMRYQRTGDDQEVFDGPMVQFLEKPGKGLTGKDFIYLNTVYKELTGNAFWEIMGRGSIKPLLPTTVSAALNADKDEIVNYKHRRNGTDRTIEVKNMLHDRYIDPSRPYWGVGKLTKIARWADINSSIAALLYTFFENGAVFGGFIETEEVSEERVNMIKASLVNDHTSVRKWFKWGILPKGAKATQNTTNMSDMEMGATDDRFRDKILAAFGVPKSLVGLTDNVQRGNFEAAEYSFAKNTVKPAVDDLLEFLNVYIAPTLDNSGKYYFAYDEFIPANKETEVNERRVALAGQAYKTVNEVRAEEGLPPIDGGDVIYGNPFQSPLGTTVQTPEIQPGDGTETDDEVEPAKTMKQRQKHLPARVRAAVKKAERMEDVFSSIAKVAKGKEVKKKSENSDRDVKDAADHRDFVGRVESYLDRVADAVRLFNNEQKQRVIADLGHITKGVSKSDLFDLTEEVAVMVNFVEPLLRGLMNEQALAEYEAQGFEGTFDTGDNMLGKITNLASKRLGKTYNNTTAALLKIALNEGIKEGESLSQLTQRVQEVYEFSDEWRAKQVAHTESFYIANKANLEAYKQSGVVKSQRWYTAEDELVCEFCGPMHGRTIDLGDNYFKKGDTMTGIDGGTLSLNYRTLDVPPLHPNCRCFVRPEVIDIGE